MSPDVSNPALRDLTYDELYEAYFEEADALIEGGVDALLIETIFDTLNAKVALDASIQAMKKHEKQLSLMLSVTVSDLAGRTLSGQTLDAVLATARLVRSRCYPSCANWLVKLLVTSVLIPMPVFPTQWDFTTRRQRVWLHKWVRWWTKVW